MRRLIAASMILGLTGAIGSSGSVVSLAMAQDQPAPAPVLLADLDSSQLTARANDFERKGEAEFKAGHYTSAVQAWRHALVDDPKNGGVVLMLSQGLFAVGQYHESAGAVQYAMTLLPPEKWGTVVSRYKEIYGNFQDYTDELKRLEKARDGAVDNPALRFLLGFHFGYLGYPKQAVRELDKAVELAPKDESARKLIEVFKPQLKDSDAPKTPGPSDGASAPGDSAPAAATSAADSPQVGASSGPRAF